MSNNDLAHKIFNALFDDDDLNEMYSAGFIAQPLGYQISSVATIEVELDNNHDRMVEEIAELRGALKSLIGKGIDLLNVEDVNDEEDAASVHANFNDAIIKSEQLLSKLNQEGEELNG